MSEKADKKAARTAARRNLRQARKDVQKQCELLEKARKDLASPARIQEIGATIAVATEAYREARRVALLFGLRVPPQGEPCQASSA